MLMSLCAAQEARVCLAVRARKGSEVSSSAPSVSAGHDRIELTPLSMLLRSAYDFV